MGRADIEVPSRGVDGDSRPRRACYPRGNFSVTSGPHQWGHGRSLGPAFAPGSLTVEDPVRPAFAFALYGGFLSRLSRPLGPLDIFSRGCRPSQTAHQSLSQRISSGQRHGYRKAVFHWRLPLPPGEGRINSFRLRYALATMSQRQAAVKVHGVFFSRWRFLDYSPSNVGSPGSRWGQRGPR